MRVEFEHAHLRAAEKAARLMRLLDEVDEKVFMGVGSADRTLAIEFMDELVDRMKRSVDETSSLRVDNVRRIEVHR